MTIGAVIARLRNPAPIVGVERRAIIAALPLEHRFCYPGGELARRKILASLERTGYPAEAEASRLMGCE